MAQFRIDQGTSGTPGEARHDLVAGQAITLVALDPAPGAGVSYTWEIVDKVGSTADLTATTGDTVQIWPPAEIVQPCGFKIRLTANDNGTITVVERIASVRTATASLRYALFGELAPFSHTLGANDPIDSTDNATYPDLAGLGSAGQNWRSYAEWAREVVDALEAASAGGGGPPTGSAGGDLSGNYPNPVVSQIQQTPISSSLAPLNGQALIWNDTPGEWQAQDLIVAPTGAAGGDLSGNYPNPGVDGIQGIPVLSTTPLDGQFLLFQTAGPNSYVPTYYGLQTAYDWDPTVTLTAATPIAITTSGVGQDGITITDGSDTLTLRSDTILLNGSPFVPTVSLQEAYEAGNPGAPAGAALTLVAATPIAITTSGVGQNAITISDTVDDITIRGDAIFSDQYLFSSSVDSGMVFTSSNKPTLVVAGAQKVRVESNQTIILNQLWATDGTALLPAYSFSAASSWGMWRDAANSRLSFSIAGSEEVRIDANGMMTVNGGSIALPAISMGNREDGFYSNLTGFAYAINGNADVLSVDQNQFRVIGGGSVAAPGYAWTGSNTNMGMYRLGSTVIGLSVAGTSVYEGRQLLTTDNLAGATIATTVQQAGAENYSALRILVTETTTGAGGAQNFNALIDARVGGTPLWTVDNTGTLINGTVPTSQLGGTVSSAQLGWPLLAPDGSALAPSYSFTNSSNAGFFRTATDIQFAYSGNAQWRSGSGYLAPVSDGAITFGQASRRATRVFTGPGTAAAPAVEVNFLQSETGNGLYAVSSNSLGVATAGSQRLHLTSTTLTSTVPILLPAGTSTAPALAFSADATEGFYRFSNNAIAYTVGGANPAAIISASYYRHADPGSNSAPTYSFTFATGTGMYSNGSGHLHFAQGGFEVANFEYAPSVDDSNIVNFTGSPNPSGTEGTAALSINILATGTGNANNATLNGLNRLFDVRIAGTTYAAITSSGGLNRSLAGALLVSSGTATEPSLGFLGDLDSGLYLNADGDVGMSIAGAGVVRWTANAMIPGADADSKQVTLGTSTTRYQALYLAEGSAASPALSIAADGTGSYQGTGLFGGIVSANVYEQHALGITIDAIEAVRWRYNVAPDIASVWVFHSEDWTAAGQADGLAGWTAHQVNVANAGGGGGDKRVLEYTVGGSPVWAVDHTGTLVVGTVPSAAVSGHTLQQAYNAGAATITLTAAKPIALTTSGVGQDGITVTDTISTTHIRGDYFRITGGGTVAAPALVLGGDATEGLYRYSGGGLSFTDGGFDRFVMLNSGVRVRDAGSAAAPAWSWTGETTTGLFRSGTSPAMSAGGTEAVRWNSSGQTLVPSGSAGSPTYSFISDLNTGMYLIAEDQLGFSTAGGLLLRLNDQNPTAASGSFVFTDIQANAAGLSGTAAYIATNINIADGTTTGSKRWLNLESSTSDFVWFEYQQISATDFTSYMHVGRRDDGGNLTDRTFVSPCQIQFTTSAGTPKVSTPLISSYTNLAFVIAGSTKGTFDNTGLALIVGASGSPSLHFDGDVDTGIYRPSSGRIRVQGDSADIAEFVGGAAPSVRFPTGSATTPSISFLGDVNTGFYNTVDTSINITINGSQQYIIDGDQISPSTGQVNRLGNSTTGWNELWLANGTQASPAIKFVNDIDAGFYLSSAGIMRAVVGNTTALEWRADQNRAASGSLAFPGLSWIADADTGLYWTSSGRFRAAGDGAAIVEFAGGANPQIRAQADGSASAPPYAFENEGNTGIFRAGAGILGFTTGGNEVLRAQYTIGAGSPGYGADWSFDVTNGIGYVGMRVDVVETSANTFDARLLQLSRGGVEQLYVWRDGSIYPGGEQTSSLGFIGGAAWSDIAVRRIDVTNASGDDVMLEINTTDTLVTFEYNGDATLGVIHSTTARSGDNPGIDVEYYGGKGGTGVGGGNVGGSLILGGGPGGDGGVNPTGSGGDLDLRGGQFGDTGSGGSPTYGDVIIGATTTDTVRIGTRVVHTESLTASSGEEYGYHMPLTVNKAGGAWQALRIAVDEDGSPGNSDSFVWCGSDTGGGMTHRASISEFGTYLASNGSFQFPAYTFVSDSTVGMFYGGTDLVGIGVGDESVYFDNNTGGDPELRGHADNTWILGSASERWKNVYAVTTTIGDLNMKSLHDDAHWTINEDRTGIYVHDRRTGKKYKLLMEEVTTAPEPLPLDEVA